MRYFKNDTKQLFELSVYLLIHVKQIGSQSKQLLGESKYVLYGHSSHF